MNIEVELVPGSWERALRAARNTVWKSATFATPSDKFKAELCMSEHSPLRLVEYYVHIEGIKYWQTAHWTRHKLGVEWFQSSMRDDRQQGKYEGSRDDAPQGLLVNLDCQVNASELIYMARRRLCGMAHAETRLTMHMILSKISEIDPIVANHCIPNCIYRGFCPEAHGCGYNKTDAFKNQNLKYFLDIRKKED